MADRLVWERDGDGDWPNAAASRFVDAGGLRWHVQVAGEGPGLLLLHGTGASTHSFRDLLPLLAEHFTVVAPDLPGHGFTGFPRDSRTFSLPGMAAAISALCDTLGIPARIGTGHSAGAAVLARQCLDGALRLEQLISLNGALTPFPGVSGHLFGPLARLMSMTAFVPRLFAWQVRTDPGLIPRMLEETGSCIDARGRDLYRRLAGSPGHVWATLEMMARWDLHALAEALPRLRVPVLLVGAERDRTTPPAQARHVAAMLPDAHCEVLPGLGHLAHEEAPALVAQLIVETVRGGDAPDRAVP